MGSPADAFAQALKSKDLYSLDQCTVRPYDRSKLKVLKQGVTPLPLRPRLPPDSQQTLDNLWSTVVRSDREVELMLEAGEATPVVPYWDASLRGDRAARVSLFRELADIGLVGFQLRMFCRAALFFVDKKGTQIRMIVDGREASLFCTRPPYTPLGSAGAWSEVDLLAETLEASGIPGGCKIFGAAADLSDGFHQFTDTTFGSLFGFLLR